MSYSMALFRTRNKLARQRRLVSTPGGVTPRR